MILDAKMKASTLPPAFLKTFREALGK
jgi:hypothetical protein